MIEDHLQNLRERSYSPMTVNMVKGILFSFASWLWNQKTKKIQDATEEDIEAYLLYHRQKGDSGSWLKSRLWVLKGFYRFLRKSGLVLKDPADGILGFRKINLLRDVPSEKEVEWFLNQPNTQTQAGVRNRAILELFYSSGLRSQELRDLRLDDADLQQRTVRIRFGKWGRGRMVPLGKLACQWIARYLEYSRPRFVKIPEETRLFLTKDGKIMKDFNIRSIFLRHRKKLRKFTAHALRHACALHMLRGGAALPHVQKLLGHKKPSTTQIYTRLYPEDLKQAHQKHHPRERITLPPPEEQKKL